MQLERGFLCHAQLILLNAHGDLTTVTTIVLPPGLALEADIPVKAGVVVAVVKAAIQRADHDPGTVAFN